MSQLRPSSELDRFMMREELRRLEARGFSFKGKTEEEKLGVDKWILGVAVVEEKSSKSRKGKHGAA